MKICEISDSLVIEKDGRSGQSTTNTKRDKSGDNTDIISKSLNRGKNFGKGGEKLDLDPTAPASTLKNGTKAKLNNIEYTYDQKNHQWVSKDGNVATGDAAMQLFKAQGVNPDGSPIKKGMMQRAKDYWKDGSADGVAQATRSDPNASLARKGFVTGGTKIASMLMKKPGATTDAPDALNPLFKAQIDDLTKEEKQYLIIKLGQFKGAANRGADNPEMVRGGAK